MADTIAENKLIMCPTCQKPSRVPQAITPDLLPVTFTCPRCKTQFTWELLPELPKIPPVKFCTDEAFFAIISGSEAAMPVASLAEYLPGHAEVEQVDAAIVTFQQRADTISTMLLGMFQHTHAMVQDIQTFERNMAAHFAEQHRLTKSFANCWKTQYLQEFLINPFVTVKLPCESEQSTNYARYVLAPKFFVPHLGIVLPGTGGFRVELLNQFTRITMPLNDILLEYLDLPRNLDLQVHGSKIIGLGLRECWRDIPGIEEDIDHVADWPSTIIRNQVLARCWLVNHGIAPWQSRPIADSEIFTYVKFEELNTDTLYHQAWQTFAAHGRLLICWRDCMRARAFAHMASSLVKGPKYIFISDHAARDRWLAVQSQQRFEHRRDGEFTYITNNDSVNSEASMMNASSSCKFHIDSLRGINCIIVDLDSGVNQAMLRELYRYNGRVLVICREPFMDFQAENKLAQLTYGLTGWASYEQSEVESKAPTTPGTKASAASWPVMHVKDEALLASLRQLRKYPD